LPSAGLALRPVEASGKAVEQLAQRLRDLPVPVIGHIEAGRLVLDLRCLEDEAGFIANLSSSFPRKRESRASDTMVAPGPPPVRG
jgi:L-seryl-tRNA(Ser) seleniumtransferase